MIKLFEITLVAAGAAMLTLGATYPVKAQMPQPVYHKAQPVVEAHKSVPKPNKKPKIKVAYEGEVRLIAPKGDVVVPMPMKVALAAMSTEQRRILAVRLPSHGGR